MEYIYLVERKSDNKRYVMYGNKHTSYGLTHLFEFAPDDYSFRKKSPYGYIYNISGDYEYNSKFYKIIYQVEWLDKH